MIDSKHTETIALLCQVTGANKEQGITVKSLADQSNISFKSIYRIMSQEDLGFFKSRWPMRPQGYYFDEIRASDSITARVQESLTALTVMQKAVKLTEEAKKLNDSFTPLGRLLSQVTISKELDEKILTGINTWSKTDYYTREVISNAINNEKDFEKFKASILMTAIMIAQGRIKEDKVAKRFADDSGRGDGGGRSFHDGDGYADGTGPGYE